MRIKESKLRQIIRKTLIESYSGSFLPSTARKGDTPKFPVEIDPSRSTVSASDVDKALKAIDVYAVEEDLEQEEIGELRGVVNRIADCMTHKDSHQVCADKLFDAGLENAFHEIGDLLHKVDETSELNQYALNVALFLQPEY